MTLGFASYKENDGGFYLVIAFFAIIILLLLSVIDSKILNKEAQRG